MSRFEWDDDEDLDGVGFRPGERRWGPFASEDVSWETADDVLDEKWDLAEDFGRNAEEGWPDGDDEWDE